jgi:hypothetical protein
MLMLILVFVLVAGEVMEEVKVIYKMWRSSYAQTATGASGEGGI